jgi:hypothetical protein
MKIFFFNSFQTGSEAHPAPYTMGAEGVIPGGKEAGGVHLTSHQHLVPKFRMREAILPDPIRLHGVLLIKHKGKFTLLYKFLYNS